MSEPLQETSFSVIRLIPLLKTAIAAINVYPLTPENFVIQQDAYSRLGTINEDDPQDTDATAFFATLDCSRKERDTDLRFAIELNTIGFLLSIEGVGGLFFDYSIFKDEKDAAEQIIAVLMLLANGQLACLLTTRAGMYCCSEFLLYEEGSRIPVVVMTDGAYRRRWRRQDESGYEAQPLRNAYLKDMFTVPKDLFIVDRDKRGLPLLKGRTFTAPELTPLTKAGYEAALVQIGSRLTGQREGEGELGVMARNWEFWVITVAIGLALYGAALYGWLPQFVADYPFILIPVASAVGAFLGTHILVWKIHLREAHPDHPYSRFNAFLAKQVAPIRYILKAGHIKKKSRASDEKPVQRAIEDNTRKDIQNEQD